VDDDVGELVPRRSWGRPCLYDPELAQEICSRLAKGEALKEICRSDGFPLSATVHSWVRNNVNDFAIQYARAREDQAEHYADELVTIADDGQNDYMERLNNRGELVRVYDREHIARSKLRFEARQWVISKILSKKYGDKVQVTGPGGGPLQSIGVSLVTTDPVQAAKNYQKLIGEEPTE
jgi:hypothetical protein